MKLFEMSDAELDAAVQRHYDRMYDDYYHTNEPEPCCENCEHYCEPYCCILEDAMTSEEEDKAIETGDWSCIEKDKDDYCDHYEQKEYEPDWLEDDDD